MYLKKHYEELEITDDFMFGKVMEDKVLCRETLECLLGYKIGELHEVQSQKQVMITADGKPIRFDIYTRDNRAVYDAEMQNLNGNRIENLELPKRARFYQSSIDMDFISKGEPYRLLPEGNVIFICTFDPFGKGLAVYNFENVCLESPDIKLEDQTHKIFYNCTCKGEGISKELRSLYLYIQCGEINSGLTEKIHQAVVTARMRTEWRSEYMKELLRYEDAREEGREEGAKNKLTEMICRKYVKGKSIEQVAEELEESIENITDIYKIIERIVTVDNNMADDAAKLYSSVIASM